MAPGSVTNKEFHIELSKYTSSFSVLKIPASVLKKALGQRVILVLEGERVNPKRLMDCGFKFQFSNLKDCLKNLFSKKSDLVVAEEGVKLRNGGSR